MTFFQFPGARLPVLIEKYARSFLVPSLEESRMNFQRTQAHRRQIFHVVQKFPDARRMNDHRGRHRPFGSDRQLNALQNVPVIKIADARSVALGRCLISVNTNFEIDVVFDEKIH